MKRLLLCFFLIHSTTYPMMHALTKRLRFSQNIIGKSIVVGLVCASITTMSSENKPLWQRMIYNIAGFYGGFGGTATSLLARNWAIRMIKKRAQIK